MSRKHYEQVAEILRKFPFGTSEASQAVLARAFAEMFSADNPRFDRERFYIACDVGIV